MIKSFSIHPNATHLLIRTNEISLKGKNRYQFEQRLIQNIKRTLSQNTKFEILNGRLLLRLSPTDITNENLLTKVSQIGGITGIAPCVLTSIEADSIQSTVTDWAKHDLKNDQSVQTFAVRTRRVNKNFPIQSTDFDAQIGSSLKSLKPELKTDLKKPDWKINIEIRKNHSIIYSHEQQGKFGLPQDASQRVLCLLSGGIDSPVAIVELIKRGCTPVLVHFHSKPYTSEASIEKVKKLAQVIRKYSAYDLELWLVPLLEIQKIVSDQCNERYLTVLYRRFMMKISEELAKKRHAMALLTGDSIGQVASQTLVNLSRIENGTEIPILRPLITMDKQEIVNRAREIGTYDISILPHDDACTLFASSSPTTQANAQVIQEDESKLNIYELVFAALDNAEKIKIVLQ